MTDLIVQPSDQGAHLTGKEWMPFCCGNDHCRHEFAYAKTGRQILAGSGAEDRPR